MNMFFLFLILHWYLSLFSQTFFLHRYAAHSMFTMNRGWERFFFVFTWLTQGASYLSPGKYGVLHRWHHEFTDTEEDPHSPSFTKGLFALMWKTRNVYQGIGKDWRNIHSKYKKNLPSWDRFEVFTEDIVVRVGWVALYTIFYIHFATQWWMWLLLPITILMGPVHGAIINYFAHKYGYRNFDTDDTSRNFLPVDVLMLGESYHNNHHKYMGRSNFGYKWWEVDPVFPIILLLEKMRVIKRKALVVHE